MEHAVGLPRKAKPVGWDLLDNAKSYHWFGSDGRSLCGKWVFLGWNVLLEDKFVHPDNRCKTCDRKRQKMIEKQFSET